MGTSQDRNWKIIEISMIHVRTLCSKLSYGFLYALQFLYHLLQPCLRIIVRNCTYMKRRYIQNFIVVRVARLPITPKYWMFSELHIRAGVARNLDL